MSERRWRLYLAAAVVLGLAIRVASVLARPHLAPGGDALEYLGQANLLAEGKGWIEPMIYTHTGLAVPTAKLPPLFTMVLSLCSLAGFKSFFAHRIWSAVVSTSAVVLAAGLGRQVAGRRAAAVAAFVVAVYPNLWMSPGVGMSETLSPSMVLLVLIAAYRMWNRPSWPRAVWLGAAIAAAALTRDELIVLAPLVLLPLAIGPAGRPWRVRARLLGAAAAAVIVLIGPVVGYNMSRFSHPVLVTDRFGLTLAAANCRASWYGPLGGFWSMPCAHNAVTGIQGDESAIDAAARQQALHFIGEHAGGVPAVELKRLGRTFALYHPLQQLDIEIYIESRPRFWAFAGLGMFYGLALASIWGAIVVRRRRVPIFPLVGVLGAVVVAVLLTYGDTRFRAPVEPVIAILAATAVDDGLKRIRGGDRRSGLAGSPVPTDPTSVGELAPEPHVAGAS